MVAPVPTPNDPPWNSLMAVGAWVASVLFILFIPAIFLLPYLFTHEPRITDSQQMIEFAKTDPTSVYQHDGLFTPGAVSIAGDPGWDDVAVEARLNINAFAEPSASALAGICARVSVPGDYYLLALRGDGYMDLRRVSSYAETILITTSAPVIAADTWYTVRLSAVGSNLNAYLNGALILTAADATYSAGEIGLQTDGAAAQFDDVVVTTP